MTETAALTVECIVWDEHVVRTFSSVRRSLKVTRGGPATKGIY